MKKVRSLVGIALAVIVITSVFTVLPAPTIAIPDTPESQSEGEQFAYAKHLELQNRPVEHPQSFEDMKKLMAERIQLLSERLEDIDGSSVSNTVQIEEGKRMSTYHNLSENFLRLCDTTAISDLSESQSRGGHLASTKKCKLQSRPSFEDLMGVDDMEEQIEYRKALQSERMEMRDKSEDSQPIVTFVHSSTGNEEKRFSSSFSISPIEGARVMQGSGNLNLSGNYSTLWHQSLVANNTFTEIISDIDGDGNPDVLVDTTKYNSVTDVETVTIIAKKGTNGTHLWEQSVNASGQGNCDMDVLRLSDLDGDGLDDFIVLEVSYNESTGIATVTVIAKNGTNGTHLWEQSVSGTWFSIVLYVLDDLDGDGLSDFIFQDWMYDSVTYTETAEIIAKRGYDGTLLWEQTISGEACEMYVDWILDLDGDGLEDVIVNAWKYDFWTDTEAAKVTAKRGYDGTLLWEQTTSGWDCYMYVDWVAELDGDGLEDVIVNAWKYDIWSSTEAAKVTAKKGSNGTLLWEQSVNASGYRNCDKWVEGLTDLDGDGLDDAIVYEWVYNETADAEAMAIIAKKGNNGTHLWEQSVNGTWCDIDIDWILDLDGDSLDDVIVYEYEYNNSTNSSIVAVIAKRGYDGTHLWEQSVNASGYRNCDKWVEGLTDLDGDGLDDAIVYEWVYNETADAETVKLIAKKGSNGTHLWEQSVNASGYWNCEMWLDWFVDLDGDSRDDIIVYEWLYNESADTEAMAIIAKKGTNGTHLWEQSVNGTWCDIDIDWILDLDGDSLDDVIVYEYEYNNSTNSSIVAVIAKRGYDGTHLWGQSVNASGYWNCDIWIEGLTDLDGDGLDDVIVHKAEYNETTDIETVAIIAKKGTNGTHLWEQSVSGTECFIWAWPLFDLDVDGLDDVIVHEWAYNESTDTMSMEVIAKRGYDGTHLWEQSLSDTECFIIAYPIVDLDGDGGYDFIVYEYEYNASVDTEEMAVIAKRGYDGTHLWEQSVNASGYWNCDIWAEWLVDLDDDGLDDVIVYEGVYNESTDTETIKVIAKRGYDGTHLFEVQSDELIGIATWSGGYDLDGDGQNDLLLWISTEMYAVTHSGIYPNIFDTDEPTIPYPSIMGTYTGTITPLNDLVVHTLYTYPCPGTGGHSESVRIWGDGINVNATWDGYVGDWHNITFDEQFVTLAAGNTYNITIELGSYPQIIHETPVNATGGTITCTEFEDANGKTYNDWIPAIRID